MKKILCLFLLFIIPFSIQALSLDSVSCSKDAKKKIERKYLWYENKETHSYFRKGESLPGWSLVSENKKPTQFSAWSFTKPKEAEERKIEERTQYAYQDLKTVSYFFITDFGKEPLYINELSVYDEGNRIDVDIECLGCSDHFKDFVTDGSYEPEAFVTEKSLIRITVPSVSHRLQFEMVVHSEKEGTKNWNVKASYDKEGKDVSYALSFENDFINPPKENYGYACDIVVSDPNNPIYTDVQYSLEEVEMLSNRKIEKLKEYRYQDILYMYQLIEKQYTSTYTNVAPTSKHIKDETKYKDFITCETKDMWFNRIENTVSNKNLKKEAHFPASSFITKELPIKMEPKIPIKTSIKEASPKFNIKIYFYFVYSFLLLFILCLLYRKYRKKRNSSFVEVI